MKLKKEFMYYAKVALNRLGFVGGQIELTSNCFQHCRGCVSWQESRGMFSLDQLKTAYNQLKEFITFEHLTLTGGDPQTWEPLDRFLRWHLAQDSKFKLQINTAIAREIKDVVLWREAVDDFKVSMDARSIELFRQMRGDQQNTPQTIMERCKLLKHPRLAFNITVYPENQHEFIRIIRWLNREYEEGLDIRKIMITAAIGSEACRGVQDKEFYSTWYKHKDIILADETITVNTSFHEHYDEDELLIQKLCVSSEVRDIRCWAGLLGFHIKPNGDFYPCCIVGGEVSETLEEYKLGNVFETDLKTIYKRCLPEYRYATKKACRENCMYKQLSLNMITEEANKITLALP